MDRINPIPVLIKFIVMANYLTTFCLDIAWVVYCARYLCLYVLSYRACKRAPDLHPIHRDVQYLSRQRKLYNFKTHILKYTLLILYLCVEMSSYVWFGICILSHPNSDAKFHAKRNQIKALYPHCYIYYHLAHFFLNPIYIILYNLGHCLIFLQFFLLCVLIRYLAARYFNHPFKRTLFSYLVWLVVQYTLVAVCSTIYTYIHSLLLIPLLLMIDWLALLRDSRKLSRVLESNLREIKLHSSNTALKKEQYLAYRSYRILHRFLLLTSFFCHY